MKYSPDAVQLKPFRGGSLKVFFPIQIAAKNILHKRPFHLLLCSGVWISVLRGPAEHDPGRGQPERIQGAGQDDQGGPHSPVQTT